MSGILITGASGFVGQYMVPALLETLPEQMLHAWCFHTAPTFPSIVNTSIVDLLDEALVKTELNRIKPDVIFHLAGQANVAKSILDPVGTFQQNVKATLNLLEACRIASPNSTFFLISSGDVYGTAATQGLLSEETLPEPVNFYSTSKLCAEKIVQAYCRDFGLKTVILRPFNHIGAGQLPIYAISSFAQQIARIEQGLAPAVLSVGNIDVERDILDVNDTVAAYVLLIKQYKTLKNAEIINICSGESRAIASLLKQLLAFCSVPIDVQIDSSRIRSNDIVKIHASNAKLRILCPTWTYEHDLQKTLKAMLDFFRVSFHPSPDQFIKS